MLNLKKGLALVLAAATALTFAPISNLSAPVAAQAADVTALEFVDATGKVQDVSSIDLNTTDTTTKTLNFKIKNDSDNQKVTWTTGDQTVATVVVTDDGGTNTNPTGSNAYTNNSSKVTVTAVAEGATTLTIKLGNKALKTVPVNVLGNVSTDKITPSETDTTVTENSTSYKIGELAISGKNFSKSLNNIPNTSSVTFSVDAASDKNKGLLSDADFTVGNVKVNSTVSATADINVDASSAKVGDQYTVTVNGVDADPVKITFTIVKAAKSDFTYGGVLNNIYAYKNATYDLAQNASISYLPEGVSDNRVTLNSNEINWYLIDGSEAAKPVVGTERANIRSLNIPTTAATVTNGQAGTLKLTISNPDAFKTALGTAGARIVGEAYINGVRTIVYVGTDKLDVNYITENVKQINAGVTVSKQATGTKSDTKLEVLDEKIANPDKDNIYLKASEVIWPDAALVKSAVQTGNKYDLTVNKGNGNDNPFKGSFLAINADKLDADTDKLPTGNYYETAYIPFKVTTSDSKTTYILKVDITVSVNTGVQFRVKDGSSILATTYDEKLATDPTVYLNLADKKTFDIFEHIESDVDKTKVSFSYDKDSSNVDVDAKGVITPKSVGNAKITINAKYNGITSSTTLKVRVSQYGFDTVTVKGQDGETARVLDVRDYDNNNEADINKSTSNGEYQLVTRQIPYVQIEITGSETSNVVESPVVTSANGAKLTYSFDDDVKTMSDRGLTIDPSTGKITLDYTKCTDTVNKADGKDKLPTVMVPGVYAVKVVSAATSKSEATTSYYYVVVDYPDQKITGLEDHYTIGACSDPKDAHYPAVDLYTESSYSAKWFTEVNKNTDDFNGVRSYADDNAAAFDTINIGQTGYINAKESPSTPDKYKATVVRAFSDKQTAHVVAFNKQDLSGKKGATYKLITLTSAPAVENKVDKITNRDTGAVIYDSAKDSTKTAVRLSINDITHIQVTLTYPVASGSSIGFDLLGHKQADDGRVVNQPYYVTAVKNTNNVDVTLYPNFKGTQVIGVYPTGHLTPTDRRDVHHTEVLLAVEYDGSNGNTAKPAKITGVKVGNKKGAKVVVKFTKSSLDKNGLSMKYYVQKKVGKKTSGKSIGSARTTLSVKKGATVKVRVKAYYYDAAGQKHVGAYSKWVTKKTDKK